MLELIDETLAGIVEQKTTNTSERLRSQELDFRLGLVGVDETGGVYLNLLEIHRVRAD